MFKVIITGGAGYIGIHTIVDLLSKGFSVISIDNNCRSYKEILQEARHITGHTIKNYPINLCDAKAVEQVFQENADAKAVIHFAAYKNVDESVDQPLLYYKNNIFSLLNILKNIQKFQIPYFIYSSSCSVYGIVNRLPVTEDTPLSNPESPYANTKRMGEEITYDFSIANPCKAVLLRYFNPVGAHESGFIGEIPFYKSTNLFTVITQCAIGKKSKIIVFGNDYETSDGTCIRDYIHVMDIAEAHTKSLEYLIRQKKSEQKLCCETFNLGTGTGITVLEALKAFERNTNQKLNYEIGQRRAGDIPAIYANNDKAMRELNWIPKRTIDEMMLSAWKWEQKIPQFSWINH
ncbi:MAG: UDP-glucose 4-epimerase GalE [Desulfobacterales bacterium]|nr:UDP-glucose 4-epimerase GalE [Desulfobacterales bacterium]